MMPCSNMVLWAAARRKGSGDSYRKIKKWHSWWSTYLGKAEPEGMVPCTGTVKVEIEPSYGGCHCCDSSSVSVTYECDACGGDFYPELPGDVDGLADLLNERTVLSKTKGKARAKAHIERHERHEAQVQEFAKEQKIKFAENRKRAEAAEDRRVAARKRARKKAKKAKKE